MFQENVNEVYKEANKKAKSNYHSRISKGKPGFLSSLDGIIKNSNISSEVHLGVKEIPLCKIIGTNSHSRATAFANDFMPLSEIGSEFSGKWTTLYKSHIEEGIRDNISVYEYLNWYYVIEGNKRVSVLKYSEAFSINAEIRRLIPKRSERKSIKLYYEFLDFNNTTGIFTIWFSKPGNFKKLQKYFEDYNPDLYINNTKYRHFVINVYNNFRKIYHKLGGQKLPITTGDAILKYIDIYGMPQEIKSTDEMNIKSLLEELKVLEKDDSIKVVTEVPKSDKSNVLKSITSILSPSRPLRIGFVNAKTPEKSGWTHSHDLGIKHIEKLFKNEILITKIENVPQNEEAYYDIKKLAEDKNDIVVTTSPTYITPTLKAALEFPKTRFLNCSETFSFKNVSTYYGRIHETKFLLGAIAGAVTKTNNIGYIAHYPIPEVINGINAFTLGASFVNPKIKVILKWNNKNSTDSFSTKPVSDILNEGADLICQDDLPKPGEKARAYGLYSPRFDLDEKKFVANIHYGIILWHWGIFYEKIIRGLMNNAEWLLFASDPSNSKRVNFWWGIDSGLIDIFYSLTHIPRSTQKMIDFLRNMIMRHELQVFSGPVFDQNGNIRIPEDDFANYHRILEMDWLVENVDGFIPKKHDYGKSDPLTEERGIE